LFGIGAPCGLAAIAGTSGSAAAASATSGVVSFLCIVVSSMEVKILCCREDTAAGRCS
jgi:hypothetical protein